MRTYKTWFLSCTATVAGMALALASGSALALGFSIPAGGTDTVEGVLNTTITFGAQWRAHDPSVDLIGKGNNSPGLCGRNADGSPLYQSCQGLFRDQIYPAQRLVSGVGQASMNADDGNLNYRKGDITQAPLKITQDINLTWGDFGFFGKVLYFYDFVNNNFTETHPNWITKDNYLQVGNVSHDTPPRSDSRPCPANRDDGNPLTPCNIVYGPGAPVQRKRTDGETLREIGTDLQMLDGYFYGKLPLWGEKQLTFKLGRQSVNWGESTLLAFGAINQANPINANNFFRVGFAVEEVFQPLGMVFLSTEPFENTTLEGFYQYEWKPLEIPAYGSYLSPADLGSNNGGLDHFNIGFGTTADDADPNPLGGGFGRLLDNPLSGITNTSIRGTRLPDHEPSKTGQFGVEVKYFAEWLNNGTELGVYFTNFHSRIPMVSMYSVATSCGKAATNGPEMLQQCSFDLPVLHGGGDPDGASASMVNFDDLRIQLEYPENIQMYGLSFNTTAGDLSLQGEVAFRPKDPLQVSLVDLAFAGFGPTLTDCHVEATGCTGSNGGAGNTLDGSGCLPGTVNGTTCVYGSSDFIAGPTASPFADTFDLAVGAMSGAGRSFPNFVLPYRTGQVAGTNHGCDDQTNANHHYTASSVLTPSSPCYIRGWEYFKTFQFDFGATLVNGATDNYFGADQVITLFEAGATWVPDLPPSYLLQLEAPGMFYHASAGADGSGADYTDEKSRRQACSNIADCSLGGDGARFNPHQLDLSLLPDKFSWGYDIISLIRYESVFPGISFQPMIVWKHDVKGTAPGVATNFIEGRKTADVAIETRYKSGFSFNVGYTWVFGGGSANMYRDRDAVRSWIKVQF